MKIIEFNNSSLELRKDSNGFISLTDLWRLTGSDENKRPVLWLRQDETRGFLKATAKFLKGDPESLLKISKGRYGSTKAVEQVALEYAQYLSPELAVLVNQAFIERVEEEQDPELAIKRGRDRAVRAYKRQGKDDAWIEARIKAVETRNSFTRVLGRHGVKAKGFRNCTNAIYTPLYGGSTDVVRRKKNLTPSANIRDNLNDVELAAINLSELLAIETIARESLHGNADCEIACNRAGASVARAIVSNRQRPKESTF